MRMGEDGAAPECAGLWLGEGGEGSVCESRSGGWTAALYMRQMKAWHAKHEWNLPGE